MLSSSLRLRMPAGPLPRRFVANCCHRLPRPQIRPQQLRRGPVSHATADQQMLEDPYDDTPAANLVDPVERRNFVMQEALTFLESDLKRIFETGEITRSRYSQKFLFEDPITSQNSVEGYQLYLRLLKSLFNVSFDLHKIAITGYDKVTARWTMGLEMWLLPWKPDLKFTGTATYTVDTNSGLITSHVDTWDSLERQQFLSLEAVVLVLQQFFKVQLTPNIESYKFTLLQKFKDFEIRSYPDYLVAETAQPMGAGPASGSGFNDLANYIFGGNREQVKMEMTTPVLSTIKPEGNQSTNMQFVMEGRFRETSQLPQPLSSKVQLKQEKGGYFGAVSFAGWPLDFEVVQQERKLREALLREGLNPEPGYVLARYNEPTVPPAVRRNEVLIELKGFQWPPAEI